MATNVTPSQQINLSKDKIRQDLIENFIKEYLELENVDLTQSSYLSFLVDVFSTLTSNLLFYQSSVYREFFLTTAQLPESVLNLSRFLGYNTREATPSSTNLLVSVPISFDDTLVYFKIPGNGTFPGETDETKFRFYAGSTEFINDQKVEVYITNSSPKPTARIKYTNVNGKSFITSGIIDTSVSPNILKFLVPVRQVKKITQEFQVDSNLRSFQFYDINVPVTGNVASLSVKITPPNLPDGSGTYWTEYDSLYLMSTTTQGYVSRRTDSGRKIFFGNDLMGSQPKPGSKIEVYVETTEGEAGNVIKGSIVTADRIYHSQYGVYNTSVTRPKIVEFTVINPNSASGGTDEESIDDIRINAINSLTSLSRLVSENDYKNLKTIVSDLPIGDITLPVLKRSDTRINEIQLYVSLYFNDEIVPTRSIYQTVPITQTSIKRNTLLLDGTDEYLALFNMTFDANDVPLTVNSDAAYYKYYISSIETSPILEDTNTNIDYNIYATNFSFERSEADATSYISITYFSDEIEITSPNILNPFADGTDHLRATADITLISNGQEYELSRPYLDAHTDASCAINSLTIQLSSVPSALDSDSTGWVIFSAPPQDWQTTSTHAYKFTSVSGGDTLVLDSMYDNSTGGINGTVLSYADDDCQILLSGDEFTFYIDGLEDEHFDEGVITFAFSFYHPEFAVSGPITRSTVNVTVSQTADQFMMSNMTLNRDSSSLTIYDIPVISKSYYDDIVASGDSDDFELLVMQKILSGTQFHNYRMLTDFLNLKFVNSTGTIRSFQYNKTTKPDVLTRTLTAVPGAPVNGDSYIVNGKETGSWSSTYTNAQLKDKIVTWNGTEWIVTDPSLEEVVAIEDENYIDGDSTSLLKVFYSEFGWISPDYEIPLIIECEIYPRQDYSDGDTALVNAVKQELIDSFSSRFGPNISLHRSEIIDKIHNVEGVDHVRLISPKTSIYFDFETSDLTEDQLLKYGPEYIFFNEDSIVVRIR